MSEDLGRTWKTFDGLWEVPAVQGALYPVPGYEPHVRDITFNPLDPATMYLALQVGAALKSTDDGQSWEQLKGFDLDTHAVVVDPADQEHVIVVTGGAMSPFGPGAQLAAQLGIDVGNGKSLFSSRDGGAHWTALAVQFPQTYATRLVYRPGDATMAYSALATGTPNFWVRDSGAEGTVVRSTDGGDTWESVDLGGDYTKGFGEAIAVDPSNPDAVYVGLNTGEILVSLDCGDSWCALDVSIPGIQDIQAITI